MREYAIRPTKYVSKTTCDWCGKDATDLQHSDGSILYKDEEYNATEMTMYFNFGNYFYMEGVDWEKEITIDLCPSCRAKLLTELEKLGIKINVEGK